MNCSECIYFSREHGIGQCAVVNGEVAPNTIACELGIEQDNRTLPEVDENIERLRKDIESKVHRKNLLELNGFNRVISSNPWEQGWKEWWVKWHDDGGLSEIRIRHTGTVSSDLTQEELPMLVEYMKGWGAE